MPPAYTRYSPLAFGLETLTVKPLACAACVNRSALSRLAKSPNCTAQPPLEAVRGAASAWRPAVAATDGCTALDGTVAGAGTGAGETGAGVGAVVTRAAAGVGVGVGVGV